MANTKSTGRGRAATPPPAKSRRVFPVGQCHHRNAAGQPDCKKEIVAKRANLCPAHEKVWQAAARVRYAANRASKAGSTPAPKATRSARRGAAPAAADAVTAAATDPEELEAALAASNARFASPELAEKHRQKRQAQSA